MWPGQLVLALIGLTAGKLQSQKKIRREATTNDYFVCIDKIDLFRVLHKCTLSHNI